MTTEEIWKPVVGYEGLYEVSDLGRIRSLNRVVTRSNGVPMPLPGGVLKHHVIRKGHHTVSLWSKGRKKSFRVHRVVAEAFIPNPEAKPFALHKDDNKEDNTVENLYWGTAKENNEARVANGKDHNRNKTHCLRGHPYNEENTYWESRGSRRCRVCQTRDKSDTDFEHGPTGYRYYKCRCDVCREAIVSQMRDYRRRMREHKQGE